MTKKQTIYFTAPRQVEIREEQLPAPAAGQFLVETVVSAISSGTEMLVYRGQFPKNLVDTHDALSSGIRYPVPYGYACVGRVVDTGKRVDKAWRDRLVFAFQPHTSHFITNADSVYPVPQGFSAETAAFLPNMETAVNLVQDGAPILGERVLVLGQGVIGLLTSALLWEFPLQRLASADCYACRREASGALGLSASLDPDALDFCAHVREQFDGGADLTFELSGNPSALDDAIAVTRFSGRVVIGSWYGDKHASLDLGGAFHRSRIRLISSQVSSIAPELSGRWDKPRRFVVAWNALKRICPERWITQRFPLERAAQAYRLLDESPEKAIQVVFEHGKE